MLQSELNLNKQLLQLQLSSIDLGLYKCEVAPTPFPLNISFLALISPYHLPWCPLARTFILIAYYYISFSLEKNKQCPDAYKTIHLSPQQSGQIKIQMQWQQTSDHGSIMYPFIHAGKNHDFSKITKLRRHLSSGHANHLQSLCMLTQCWQRP